MTTVEKIIRSICGEAKLRDPFGQQWLTKYQLTAPFSFEELSICVRVKTAGCHVYRHLSPPRKQGIFSWQVRDEYSATEDPLLARRARVKIVVHRIAVDGPARCDKSAHSTALRAKSTASAQSAFALASSGASAITRIIGSVLLDRT